MRLSDEFGAVFMKDMLELVRKPASLLLGIGLPGVMMPIFVLSISDLQATLTEQIGNVDHEVALHGESRKLRDWLGKRKRIRLVADDGGSSSKRSPDLSIDIPEGFDAAIDENRTAGTLIVHYDSLRETSMLGMRDIADALHSFKKSIAETRLRDLGAKSGDQPPFEFADEDKKLLASYFSRFHAASFLLLLVFSMYAAASSVAAEVVTGERERNTLEGLLLTPLKRTTIVRAKLSLISTVTVVATLLTLVTYSCKYFNSAPPHLSGAAMINLELVCLPLILIIVLTVVSMSMLLASYARSVQQSMGYSFYSALALFGAAGLAFNPAVTLSSPVLAMPVSGLSIAVVDVLSGRAEWHLVAIATAVGIIYCALFTFPAARLLQSDESLYNLQLSPAQRLKEGIWARPLTFLFIGVFLTMFYLGQVLLQWRALPGLILTQLIAVLLPALFFLRLYKLPFKEVLSLKRCRVTDVCAGALFAPFTVAAASALFALQSKFMPAPEEFFKAMSNLILPPGTPWWQIVISAALMPAVCEEILFRGVFQGLLSRRSSASRLIPAIGFVFGIFHFSLFRFLPTATLGMLLSYLVVRTGSIFPAMALHFTHNSIAALAGGKNGLELEPVKLVGVVVSFILAIFLLRLRKQEAKGG